MKRFIGSNPYFYGIIMWLLVALLSVFTNDWFYLDVPTFITIGNTYFDEPFLSHLVPDSTGRYFPFFIFYYAAINSLFGMNVYGYFLVQSMIILLTTLLIIYVVKWLTKGNLRICILAIILFYTITPFGENVYSIGKQEHLVLFFFLLLVFLYIKFINFTSIYRKVLVLLSACFVTVISVWTKETTIIIAGFSAISIFTHIIFNRRNLKEPTILSSIHYHLSLILSVILAKVPYYFLKNDGQSSYTSYSITIELLRNNLVYYTKHQPDVIVCGALSLLVIIFVVFTFSKWGATQGSIILGLTGLAFGYFVGLLIWRWPTSYYLYVIAAIFCIIVSVGIYGMISILDRKKMIIGCCSILILLTVTRVYSISYNIYIINSQRSMEHLYTEAIKQYTNTAKGGQRLLIENFSFYEEQIYQSNLLIKSVLNREDLSADGISDILNSITLSEEIKQLYRVNNIPSKADRLPKEGDYVLLFVGNKQSYWKLRGVTPLVNETSSLPKLGYELELITEEKKEMSTLFPFTPLEWKYQKTYLGYQLYKVTNESKYMWNGRYADNWIGQDASLEITQPKDLTIRLKINVIPYNVPNRLVIESSGKTIREIEIDSSGEQVLEILLDQSEDNHYKIDFHVSHTFVPKDVGLNDDQRELGLNIEVIQ